MPHDIRHQYTHAARVICHKIIEVPCDVGHRRVTHSNVGVFEERNLAWENGLLNPCGRVHFIIQRNESPIVRTLNLFAALEIASGLVFAQTTEQKKREDFRRFLDAALAELPADKEIHVIVDNYCTHKRNADWLDKYQGRVLFHFTPTSASWLNQVEIWFGLLTRKALRGASFASKDQLRSAIESFVTKTNQHPKPFHWRKREVKGSQLRNTIVNLRN